MSLMDYGNNRPIEGKQRTSWARVGRKSLNKIFCMNFSAFFDISMICKLDIRNQHKILNLLKLILHSSYSYAYLQKIEHDSQYCRTLPRILPLSPVSLFAPRFSWSYDELSQCLRRHLWCARGYSRPLLETEINRHLPNFGLLSPSLPLLNQNIRIAQNSFISPERGQLPSSPPDKHPQKVEDE